MEERPIPLSEVAEHFPEEAKLARLFGHKVIQDEHGTFRWKRNSLVDHLVHDVVMHDGQDKIVDLDDLCVAAHRGRFSIEEYMKFYMQMGYSLGGFRECFAQDEATHWGLPGKERTDKTDPDEYAETVIGFVLRKHKGRRSPLVI
jgi:hypothetical protein